MATLDQTTLNQIVAAVLQALGNTSTASPKAPAVSQPANSLEAKDKALVNVAFAVGAFRSIRSC